MPNTENLGGIIQPLINRSRSKDKMCDSFLSKIPLGDEYTSAQSFARDSC